MAKSSSLTSDTAFGALRDELQSEINVCMSRLVTSGADQHDRIAGRITGLQYAMTRLDQIERRWHTRDLFDADSEMEVA